MQSAHPAFVLLRKEAIPALNLTVEEYEHSATGAQHIHLQADNPENVFLVSLRTVPEDSTGVAHILEHTALCGSERYPVRDPFFMMTRRSLNTFMNALTSSDWTAYPFASVNRKDFDNLLDVYLDAVFFSRLDRLDFAQEGHRLEFAELDNPNSDLLYKGVVYNEMKGAMSSVSSVLWHTLNKYLHPATTYHYNSGGEPEDIPDLTYEQLLDFYKTHYHPSNATFMTYGDIPAAELQAKFEEQALRHFTKLGKEIGVANEKRLHAPIRVEEAYPLVQAEDSADNKTHVVMGWLLGSSTDLDEALASRLLASVLLDNSASPLMHALETTELGSAPSPLCGIEDSQKELTFVCGLEGCATDAVNQVEALIMDTLTRVAEEGVPAEDLEAALHQLELSQREVGGGQFPYGLQLIMSGLTAATHRGDAVAMLDLDAALSTLRKATAAPDFIQQQVRKLLINNQHRVRLSLVPDNELAARKETAEANQLAAIKAQLADEEKARIVADAQALIARQTQEDDPSILPKVTLEDVPEKESHLYPTEQTQLPRSKQKLTSYDVGSNGLVYQQLVMDMPALGELTQVLPYYTNCLTEVGLGQKDYLAVQRWQAAVCGGLSAFNTVRNNVDDIHSTNSFITLSGKALNRNHAGLSELMSSTLADVRFDEHDRIREIVAQIRAAKEESITSNGHTLAMSAATAGMSAASKLSHDLSGLQGTKYLMELDDKLKDPAELARFCENLAEVHAHVAAAPRQFLLVGEPNQQQKLRETFAQHFDVATEESSFNGLSMPKHTAQIKEGWMTNTAVNFCAKAYPTVSMTHPDAAPLTILGNVLRNGFLHRVIREQGGAYGGGASQDHNSASFRFYSYRDPRLTDTLQDFDAAVAWVLENDVSEQAVEEAILGTISGIDKPDSPAGRAKRFFHADLHGRTLEKRQVFRERLLNTTSKDLQRVAAQYLRPEQASTAVISDFSRESQLADLGLTTIRL